MFERIKKKGVIIFMIFGFLFFLAYYYGVGRNIYIFIIIFFVYIGFIYDSEYFLDVLELFNPYFGKIGFYKKLRNYYLKEKERKEKFIGILEKIDLNLEKGIENIDKQAKIEKEKNERKAFKTEENLEVNKKEEKFFDEKSIKNIEIKDVFSDYGDVMDMMKK